MEAQIGDVVVLRGQNTRMTINHISEPDDNKLKWAECVWFENGNLYRESFTLGALMKVQ